MYPIWNNMLCYCIIFCINNINLIMLTQITLLEANEIKTNSVASSNKIVTQRVRSAIKLAGILTLNAKTKWSGLRACAQVIRCGAILAIASLIAARMFCMRPKEAYIRGPCVQVPSRTNWNEWRWRVPVVDRVTFANGEYRRRFNNLWLAVAVASRGVRGNHSVRPCKLADTIVALQLSNTQ